MSSKRLSISGWGRAPTIQTDAFRPERIRDLFELVKDAPSLVARGCGRSYGDASLNSDGGTILMERLNRFLSFDLDSGILSCEAGVTIDEILRYLVPRGFFPPVTPGTKFVTLGGAIACDVHGKNHHQDGSLSRHVLDFDLLTSAGETLRCSRERNAHLFWATFGGMGLTGIIIRLRLQMRRISTAYVSVDHCKASHLDEALDAFDATDDQYTYSVAWIDCLARGKSLGRAILMRGDEAALEELPHTARASPLHSSQGRRVDIPVDCPGMLLNSGSVRVFNGLYYKMHRHGKRSVTHHEPFFYPLDRIGHWNRLYGSKGFYQYQLVLPHQGGREGLIRILEEIAASGYGSFLAVLKRFGSVEPEQLLSFPRPGYTLALDFSAKYPDLRRFLEHLDSLVIEYGGRVYLAKDARMRPEAVSAMYPELSRWREIKEQVDPQNTFNSDLSRRLGIVS